MIRNTKMNETNTYLPQKPTKRVAIRTKIHLGYETSLQRMSAGNRYEWQLREFVKLGLVPDRNDKFSWRGRLTQEELKCIQNAGRPIGEYEAMRMGDVVESVTVLATPEWTTGDDGEYSVSKAGLTFRLRLIWKQKTYNNLYAEVHLLTSKGWTMLKQEYLGDSYYGIKDYVRQSYERVRRHAEHLCAIGAQVSPVCGNAETAESPDDHCDTV